MRARVASVAALTVIALAGCADTTPEPPTVEGECADVYGADVCTWATLTGSGVTEFGVTIPLASIERAPEQMEMVWPPVLVAMVKLPAGVTTAMGVDHLTVYWEPHGHPPGPYLTPHFDFHFYNIANDTREAIDCADLTKPADVPAGYRFADVEIPGVGMLVGLCVPAMGMHALLASEMESGEIFDGTMVIGYYHGSPILFEPMIARHMLMRRQSFDLPMPTVSGLPDGVRYPQSFRAEYDVATDAYRFVFSGF